jgi:hypothetical protein
MRFVWPDTLTIVHASHPPLVVFLRRRGNENPPCENFTGGRGRPYAAFSPDAPLAPGRPSRGERTAVTDDAPLIVMLAVLVVADVLFALELIAYG